MSRLITTALTSRQTLKTVTYGIMHLSVAVLVAFALTRSWTIALTIGLIEPFVQTLFYNLHERIWARCGRKQIPAMARA